ncbi:MAG: hypothetical protein Q9172_006665 [Xanthocarpia lactea]
MDLGLPDLVDDGGPDFNASDAVIYPSRDIRTFEAYDESTNRVLDAATEYVPGYALLELPTDRALDSVNMPNTNKSLTEPHTGPYLTEEGLNLGAKEEPIYRYLSSSPRIVDLDVSRARASPTFAHTMTPTMTETPTTLLRLEASSQRVQKRAKPAPKQDWVKHRTLITHLYGKMALPKVMQHMTKEHGFITSERAYKRRIKEWGLDKKNKENEMRAIVRKYAERKANHKSSEFRVRGQDVDYREMVRYFARKGVSIDEVMARRKTSATPEAVICFTPVTAPIATPSVFAIPEAIFAAIRDYMNGSFDSGTWIKNHPTKACYSIKDGRIDTNSSSLHYLSIIWSHSLEACHLHELHETGEAKVSQDSALVALRHVLPLELPQTLSNLFILISQLSNNFSDSGVASALTYTMAGAGELLLCQQHPLLTIAKAFCRLHESEYAELAIKCLRAIAEGFGNHLGPMHLTSLVAYSNQATSDDLRELLQRCHAEIGVHSPRTMTVRLRLVDKLLGERQYHLARQECHNLLSTVHMVQPPGLRLEFHASGLYHLAQIQRLLSDLDLAVMTLREAIHVRIRDRGSADARVRQWVLDLRQWLIELGWEEEAAEVRRWYYMLRNAPAELQPELAWLREDVTDTDA